MIFPLKDSVPRLHTPYATWGIIVVTVLLFIWEQLLTPPAFRELLQSCGVMPHYLLIAKGADIPSEYLTLVTYTLLHGGWWHLIANMWIFWIFADNIEDVMGPTRLTIFYILCGIIAAISHVIANTQSVTPVVGASGAISGILGAYFLLYPNARVTTFVFFLILDLPATVYLGGWFIYQLIAGLTSIGAGSGIAWWAHLGGFVAGMLLMPFFKAGRPVPVKLPPGGPPPPPPDHTDPWARLRSK